jgi:hypothetical protein
LTWLLPFFCSFLVIGVRGRIESLEKMVLLGPTADGFPQSVTRYHKYWSSSALSQRVVRNYYRNPNNIAIWAGNSVAAGPAQRRRQSPRG